MKFGRTYNLTVQTDDVGTPNNTLTVSYPLTMRFNIQRSTLATMNTGQFVIYNLAESTRRRISLARHDYQNLREISMVGGYSTPTTVPTPGPLQAMVVTKTVPVGSQMGLIFRGNISAAYSYKERVDWMTVIEAFDGGYDLQNAQVATTYPKAADLRSMILDVIKTMTNTSVGGVGAFSNDNNARGRTVMGPSWEQVGVLAGPDAQTFIDNQKAYVLKSDEYVDVGGPIFVINSKTGLLATPRWQDAKLALPYKQQYGMRVDVTMIFEPRLQVGQLVQLQSLETVFNGLYTVAGITHRGTISGVVGSDCVTALNLIAASRTLKPVAS